MLFSTNGLTKGNRDLFLYLCRFKYLDVRLVSRILVVESLVIKSMVKIKAYDCDRVFKIYVYLILGQ